MPFDLGPYTWMIYVAGAILVLGVVWGVVQFFMKLTMKVFALGCLGILVVGLGCGALAYFGGGS
jgi:FtsH-binding integral membrane protein